MKKFEERAGIEPDLHAIQEDFLWTVERRDQSIFSRQRMNYRSRYCIWAGQNEDGRKWVPRTGEDEVFPWPGAADTRVHLVDGFINEDAALLMTVWRRNRITVSAQESNDEELATRLTQVLRWMKFTQMREARAEVKLMANYKLERGAAVCGIVWDRQRQLGYDELDMETIAGKAMDAQAMLDQGMIPPGVSEQDLADIARYTKLIMDPTEEEAAAQIFLSYFPDVKVAVARRVIRDLRENGWARFPRPYVIKDRPALVALAANEEIFVPQDATDIQTARAVYRRELVTETTLQDRINTHGWDPAWVKATIETQRGIVSSVPDVSHRRSTLGYAFGSNRYGTNTQDPSKLFEVIHAWQRQHDTQGVPGIYYTVYCPGLVRRRSSTESPTHAYHGLLNYDHGQYPFVLLRREMRSRIIDDSRGYGEIGGTWQDAIKAEIDSRRDRASISTCPPMFHPPGQAPERWGPGVKLGTMTSDRYGFFQGPNYDRGSKESEDTMRRLADRYFGRVTPEDPFPEAALLRQAMIDDWMDEHAQIDTQILQLMQQFMPDEFYFRVVGSTKGKPMRASREEIQGQFDVAISYNIDNLDTERLDRKFTFIERALAWDSGGRIDRDEVVAVGFELIDPNLGERVLKPGQSAAVGEIDDERNVLAQMSAGIPVDIKPGQAYQHRKDWLVQTIQANQNLLKRYEADQGFKERVDERLKQLDHQIQQKTVNAETGRLGGKPAYARNQE